MLVTVLVVTAIGLLLGVGALLLFRYQCQLRIDRQHELEKVYAVRSALNYTRLNTGEIPDSGKVFRFHTGSDRNLKLIVKPVDPIFPLTNATDAAAHHFVMERGDFYLCDKQYSSYRDYEYGVNAWTNLVIGSANTNGYGLCFNDLEATNNVKWWVNIGMRGTGGWLQEDYGRRYCFWPQDYVDGTVVKDAMRLCIIRNVTNESNRVGCRHGWPLSQEGERAIVFQVSPLHGDATNNAEISLHEYRYEGGQVWTSLRLCMTNCPSLTNMGLQLAADKTCAFFIENDGEIADKEKQSSHGYTFSDTVELTPETLRYFSDRVWIGGHGYPGVFTNAYGRLEAPELRAVFEVVAASDQRKTDSHPNTSNRDFLTKFRVTPAYQYDVFIVNPETVTNLATVAQKIGRYSRASAGRDYTLLTYDTHGTDHKGFRYDEKHAGEKSR